MARQPRQEERSAAAKGWFAALAEDIELFLDKGGVDDLTISPAPLRKNHFVTKNATYSTTTRPKPPSPSPRPSAGSPNSGHRHNVGGSLPSPSSPPSPQRKSLGIERERKLYEQEYDTIRKRMRQVVNRKLAGNRRRARSRQDGETSPAPEEAAVKDYDEGDDESFFADFEEVSIAAGLVFDDDRTAATPKSLPFITGVVDEEGLSDPECDDDDDDDDDDDNISLASREYTRMPRQIKAFGWWNDEDPQTGAQDGATVLFGAPSATQKTRSTTSQEVSSAVSNYVIACSNLNIEPKPILDYLVDRNQTKSPLGKQQAALLLRHFFGNPQAAIAVAVFIEELHIQLIRLDLGGGLLTDFGLTEILRASHKHPIEEFNLEGNLFKRESSEMLLKVLQPNGPIPQHLVKLNLSGSRLRPAHSCKLLKLLALDLSCPKIEHLNMSTNDMSEIECSVLLGRLLSNNMLKSLDASNCHLSGDSMFEGFEETNPLTSLNLSMNHFVELSFWHDLSTTLTKNANLKVLDLNGNNIYDASVILLASGLIKSTLNAIDVIDLSGNPFGAAAVRELISSIFVSRKRVKLEQCFLSAASPPSSSSSSLPVFKVRTLEDVLCFEKTFCEGEYELDIGLPHGRILALNILRNVHHYQQGHDASPLKFVTLTKFSPGHRSFSEAGRKFDPPASRLVQTDGGLEVEFPDATELLPCQGILRFTLLMQKRRRNPELPRDLNEFVTAWVHGVTDHRDLVHAIIVTMGSEYSLSPEAAVHFLKLVEDKSSRSAALVKIFPNILEKETMTTVASGILNELEFKRTRNEIGLQYFHFIPSALVGHYRLDLSRINDRLLYYELSEQNAMYMACHAEDGCGDGLMKNCFLESMRHPEADAPKKAERVIEAVSCSLTWRLPLSGILEFDVFDESNLMEGGAPVLDLVLTAFIENHRQRLSSQQIRGNVLRQFKELNDDRRSAGARVSDLKAILLQNGFAATAAELEDLSDLLFKDLRFFNVKESEQLFEEFEREDSLREQLARMRAWSRGRILTAEQLKTILKECCETAKERLECFVVLHHRVLDQEKFSDVLDVICDGSLKGVVINREEGRKRVKNELLRRCGDLEVLREADDDEDEPTATITTETTALEDGAEAGSQHVKVDRELSSLFGRPLKYSIELLEAAQKQSGNGGEHEAKEDTKKKKKKR